MIPCYLVAIVFFVAACVKKIMELGRRFPWPRTERCPRCGSVRRFRCPDCWAVIQLRPRGYWSRFQAPVEIIRQSLSKKLARGRWATGLPHPRQRHWLKVLLRQVGLYLGSSWSSDLLGTLDWLSSRGWAVASRSAQSESPFTP
ncbi:transposase [Desulfarculales bacterium]